MKLSLPIFASLPLVVRAANTANGMLRKEEDENRIGPKSLYDRKLFYMYDINEGTPVVDLCDYHPDFGVFNPLLINVAEGIEPDKVFKIENAAGIRFKFSIPCDATYRDASITVWDGFDKGNRNYLTYRDNACDPQSSTLSWTAPDDSIYLVRFYVILAIGYSSSSTDATWSTGTDWGYCFPPTVPYQCGTSILYPSTGIWDASHTLLCCDDETGAVGPNCCGAIPYDASISACCDGNVVSGTDASCAPSSEPSTAPSTAPSPEPSSAPSSEPSPSPSSQPSQLTCEMVNPCDYDMEHDGVGGVNIIETYYPVCVSYRNKNDQFVYCQKCYPEGIIAGLSAGDDDPNKRDRKILNCGCCPSDDMLPAGIDEVKGSTNVCNGGLDCFAEGADILPLSDTDILFEICVDGAERVDWKNNFYMPLDGETVSCGQCPV